jgi:hypothetical protein
MSKPMNKYSIACIGIRFLKPYNNVHTQILGFMCDHLQAISLVACEGITMFGRSALGGQLRLTNLMLGQGITDDIVVVYSTSSVRYKQCTVQAVFSTTSVQYK